MGKFNFNEAIKVWDNCFATRQDQKDAFGRMIKFEEYGKTHSKFGWEIDHIWPLNPDKGDLLGANSTANVQPLHCESNEEKRNRLDGHINNKHFVVLKKRTNNNKVIGYMKVQGELAYDYIKWQ